MEIDVRPNEPNSGAKRDSQGIRQLAAATSQEENFLIQHPEARRGEKDSKVGRPEWKKNVDPLAKELAIRTCVALLTAYMLLLILLEIILEVAGEIVRIRLRQSIAKWGFGDDNNIYDSEEIPNFGGRIGSRRGPRVEGEEKSTEKGDEFPTEEKQEGMSYYGSKKHHSRAHSNPSPTRSQLPKPTALQKSNLSTMSTAENSSGSDTPLSNPEAPVTYANQPKMTTGAPNLTEGVLGDSTEDSKKLLVVVKQQPPLPGTPGIPIFEGENVSAYINFIDELATDYNLDAEEKRKKIVRYAVYGLKERIKAIPEYCENNPESYNEDAFRVALHLEFQSLDWESTQNSRDYLAKAAEESLRQEIPLKYYVDLYHRISNKLVAAGEMDERDQCELFLTGFTQPVLEMIFRSSRFTYKDKNTWKYGKLYKAVKDHYEVKEESRHFMERKNPELIKQKTEVYREMVRSQVPESLTNSRTYRLPTQQASEPGAEPKKKSAQSVSWKLPDTRSAKVATVPEIDKLVENMKNLSLAAITQDDLSAKLNPIAEALSRIQATIAAQGQYALNQNNGYQGNNNRYQNQGRGNGGQQWKPTVQGNSLTEWETPNYYEVDVNAAWNSRNRQSQGQRGPNQQQGEPRTCYMCWGMDEQMRPSRQEHEHASLCFLTQDLIRKGCIHWGMNGRVCAGPPGKEQPEREIFLTSSKRWYDQIVLKLSGSEYDVNESNRPANAQRAIDDRELAQEEADRGAGVDKDRVQAMQILRRDKNTVKVQNINVTDAVGNTLDEYYEEESTAVLVSAVGPDKSSKERSGVKEIIQRRRQEEDKLPQAKSQRKGTMAARQRTDPAEDMDIDELNPVDRLGDTQTIDGDPSDNQEEEDMTRRRRRKLTVPLPKVSKGVKTIIDTFKSPDPAEALVQQYIKETRHWRLLIEAGLRVSDMMNQDRSSGRLPHSPVVAAIQTIKEATEDPEGFQEKTIKLAVDHIGSERQMDYSEMIERRMVVRSPRITIAVKGNRGSKKTLAMLDTGAEVSIYPFEEARDLGAVIHNAEHIQMSSASGAPIYFAGVCELWVEIARGVGCMCTFFLIQGVPKILLGQPFITKMRMGLSYRPDGTVDGIFHDPRNSSRSCRVMVIPPLRKLNTKRSIEDMQPRVEELDSDDESEVEVSEPEN